MITEHRPANLGGLTTDRRSTLSSDGVAGGDPPVLDIALINNMPDPALDATERQFRALLAAAAGGMDVRLTMYTLPEVPRTDFGRKQVSSYSSLDDLWTRHHDGVI